LPEDVQRATAAGFNRHVAKPPSMSQLMQVIASATRDDTKSSALREEPSTPRPS
jgi:CheY-like chemotaxis protein